MSKTLALLLGLILAGCGGDPTPAERLQGTWLKLGDGTTCGKGVTFDGDLFTFQVLCGSTGAFVDDIEGGTFVATGSMVSVTMTKASCPATADRSLSFSYTLHGNTLSVGDANGIALFTRNTSPSSGNATVQFGCIASDGTFTPMPITPI